MQASELKGLAWKNVIVLMINHKDFAEVFYLKIAHSKTVEIQ